MSLPPLHAALLAHLDDALEHDAPRPALRALLAELGHALTADVAHPVARVARATAAATSDAPDSPDPTPAIAALATPLERQRFLELAPTLGQRAWPAVAPWLATRPLRHALLAVVESRRATPAITATVVAALLDAAEGAHAAGQDIDRLLTELAMVVEPHALPAPLAGRVDALLATLAGQMSHAPLATLAEARLVGTPTPLPDRALVATLGLLRSRDLSPAAALALAALAGTSRTERDSRLAAIAERLRTTAFGTHAAAALPPLLATLAPHLAAHDPTLAAALLALLRHPVLQRDVVTAIAPHLTPQTLPPLLSALPPAPHLRDALVTALPPELLTTLDTPLRATLLATMGRDARLHLARTLR